MLLKLTVIIIIAGASACALLVNRQHRIDTAHEIAVVHHRLTQQDQLLWRLRTDIAGRTRPDSIRQRIDSVGGAWVAVPQTGFRHQRPGARLAAHDAVADAQEENG